MKIETTDIKELNYDELINVERLAEKDIEPGDIILIKEKDSNIWDAQFVTLVTGMGIYLHLESDGLDGGGVILWPEHIKIQHVKKQNMYDDTMFIHIPIKKE